MFELDKDGLYVYEGGQYETELKAFYYGVLMFCGCGDPEGELEMLRDVLAYLKAKSDRNFNEPIGLERDYKKEWEEFKALFGGNEDFMRHYLYWLDSLDMTEHGGSVFGCWPTDYGKQVLALFEGRDIAADMG